MDFTPGGRPDRVLLMIGQESAPADLQSDRMGRDEVGKPRTLEYTLPPAVLRGVSVKLFESW